MACEIKFMGELHTIPAGAGLVLKVDRPITRQQADYIAEYCRNALGADQRVFVIGPELTACAVTQSAETFIDSNGDAFPLDAIDTATVHAVTD
jgi:hypothetical protein